MGAASDFKGIWLEDGKYGRRAAIESAWSPAMRDYLVAKDVVELELNYAKGWIGDDISFLRELPHLLSFMMIDIELSSLEPIHALRDLRCLSVTAVRKMELRLNEFRQLEGMRARLASENQRLVRSLHA